MATAASPMAVVALDIGSSRSAWAFSVQGCAEDSITTRVPEGALTSISCDRKTDTAVLLTSEPPHRIEAFGRAAVGRFFQAKERHDCLVGCGNTVRTAGSEAAGMLFRGFKKELWTREDYLSLDDPVATAVGGQKLSLLAVMVEVLRFFRKDVLAHLSSLTGTRMKVGDVLWAIPVPAVCSSFSKRFMRVAAHEAGLVDAIDSPQLQLCLEPEAAFQAVKIGGMVPVLSGNNTNVLILDCGGGAVAATTLGITSRDTVLTMREVISSKGGAWGSMCVDEEFTTFFRQFVGEEAFGCIRDTSAFYDLMTMWEEGKTAFGGGLDDVVPLDMTEVSRRLGFRLSRLKELCKDHDNRHQTQFGLRVARRKRVVDLPSHLVHSFFTPAINQIAASLRSLKSDMSVSGPKHVFLVGGFSASPLVQAVVRSELQGDGWIVTPTLDPDVAILRGAVLYASNIGIAKGGMIRYTDGVFPTVAGGSHDSGSVRQRSASPLSRQAEEGGASRSSLACGGSAEKKGKAAGNARSVGTEKGAKMPADVSACDEESSLGLQLRTLKEEWTKTMEMLSDRPRQLARMEQSVARMDNCLQDEKQHHQKTKDRLVQSQSDLERATVLLKKERKEKQEIRQDRDRQRDQNNKRLLAQGTDIQAALPTTGEIRMKIERALTETVSDWLEVEEAAETGACMGHMASGVFLQCQLFVRGHLQFHKDYFLGGAPRSEAGPCEPMRQDTADFMREHMRRHYSTLFPLAGDRFDEACKTIVEMLRQWVAQAGVGYIILPQAAVSPSQNVANVIKEYLNILVTAALQNPPLVFSDECGMKQPFDSKVHSQPIDGDAIQNGQKCIVVFPSLLQEADNDGGLTPLTKGFILPAVPSS